MKKIVMSAVIVGLLTGASAGELTSVENSVFNGLSPYVVTDSLAFGGGILNGQNDGVLKFSQKIMFDQNGQSANYLKTDVGLSALGQNYAQITGAHVFNNTQFGLFNVGVLAGAESYIVTKTVSQAADTSESNVEHNLKNKNLSAYGGISAGLESKFGNVSLFARESIERSFPGPFSFTNSLVGATYDSPTLFSLSPVSKVAFETTANSRNFTDGHKDENSVLFSLISTF